MQARYCWHCSTSTSRALCTGAGRGIGLCARSCRSHGRVLTAVEQRWEASAYRVAIPRQAVVKLLQAPWSCKSPSAAVPDV
jgi:hypothetical protein